MSNGPAAAKKASTSAASSRLALEVLPASLCRHTDLTSLVLNDNLLATLPPAVAAMTKLHTLVLSRNRIVELPLFVSTFTSLRVLHVQNNLIQKCIKEIKVNLYKNDKVF